MKAIRVMSTTAFIVLLGFTASANARQEKQNEKARPAQHQQQAALNRSIVRKPQNSGSIGKLRLPGNSSSGSRTSQRAGTAPTTSAATSQGPTRSATPARAGQGQQQKQQRQQQQARGQQDQQRQQQQARGQQQQQQREQQQSPGPTRSATPATASQRAATAATTSAAQSQRTAATTAAPGAGQQVSTTTEPCSGASTAGRLAR